MGKDYGVMRREVKQWWDEWGNLVVGIWSVLVSTFCVMALIVYVGDQRQSKDTARIACKRTQIIAPGLASYFERVRALPPKGLRAYRETIPKSC